MPYALSVVGRARFVAACVGPFKANARGVAVALRDTLGKAADPQVAFERDSTHLLVQLSAAAFPTVPDSALTRRRGALAASLNAITKKQTSSTVSRFCIATWSVPGSGKSATCAPFQSGASNAPSTFGRLPRLTNMPVNWHLSGAALPQML